MRDFSDLGLSHRAERCECATKLWLAQTEQKVRLIFSWVDAFAQNRGASRTGIFVMFDDRVMSGRDVIAAKRFRFAPKISEL